MRFAVAWGKIALQNISLKFATLILAIVSLSELTAIFILSSRDLPVIERSCFSKVIPAKTQNVSEEEIKSFLSESVPMRFNTDAYIKDGFLSLEELSFREKEQTALKQRQINQKVYINDIKINDKEVLINTDRVVSVASIKSVLSLNLRIILQKTNRSESNPYGLVLSQVLEQKEKSEK